jgi:hypothetical protein
MRIQAIGMQVYLPFLGQTAGSNPSGLSKASAGVPDTFSNPTVGANASSETPPIWNRIFPLPESYSSITSQITLGGQTYSYQVMGEFEGPQLIEIKDALTPLGAEILEAMNGHFRVFVWSDAIFDQWVSSFGREASRISGFYTAGMLVVRKRMDRYTLLHEVEHAGTDYFVGVPNRRLTVQPGKSVEVSYFGKNGDFVDLIAEALYEHKKTQANEVLAMLPPPKKPIFEAMIRTYCGNSVESEEVLEAQRPLDREILDAIEKKFVNAYSFFGDRIHSPNLGYPSPAEYWVIAATEKENVARVDPLLAHACQAYRDGLQGGQSASSLADKVSKILRGRGTQ